MMSINCRLQGFFELGIVNEKDMRIKIIKEYQMGFAAARWMKI